MRCRWNYCKHDGEVDKEEAIERKKGFYYHKECNKELDQYHKIKDLYHKYYNKNENWAIIIRTLDSWIKKYGIEFILFCLSKAIRERKYLNNFQSLYYILTDKRYMDKYEDYKNNKNDQEKIYGDFVILKDSQFYDLLEQLGEQKLYYYINQVNKYMKSSGKTYKSFYDTILLWEQRNRENEPEDNGIRIHGS